MLKDILRKVEPEGLLFMRHLLPNAIVYDAHYPGIHPQIKNKVIAHNWTQLEEQNIAYDADENVIVVWSPIHGEFLVMHKDEEMNKDIQEGLTPQQRLFIRSLDL